MHKLKSNYESPQATLIDLHAEGVLCGSEWYLQGGQGNFDFNVTEDDEFAG